MVCCDVMWCGMGCVVMCAIFLITIRFLLRLQGDIVTCAGTYLYLWSINGQLVVEENTSLRPSNAIHCCLMSEVRVLICHRFPGSCSVYVAAYTDT